MFIFPFHLKTTPLHTSNPSIYDLLFNPFTVAEVSATDVTLVLRILNGPTTTALDVLTHLPKAKAPINIEAPLGSSSRFPNLAPTFDRILLVAGGVGATFILPIYQNLREQLENESKSADRVTLTWSMRSAAEATWAVGSEIGAKLEEDENVKIFLTRSNADDREHNDDLISADASVELDELQWTEEPIKATGGRDRPDLRRIVDEL